MTETIDIINCSFDSGNLNSITKNIRRDSSYKPVRFEDSSDKKSVVRIHADKRQEIPASPTTKLFNLNEAPRTFCLNQKSKAQLAIDSSRYHIIKTSLNKDELGIRNATLLKGDEFRASFGTHEKDAFGSVGSIG